MSIFIGVRQKNLFVVYTNNHIGAVKTFDVMYTFLRDSYFTKVAFGLVYLLEKKIKAFIDILELLGFEKNCKKLRL